MQVSTHTLINPSTRPRSYVCPLSIDRYYIHRPFSESKTSPPPLEHAKIQHAAGIVCSFSASPKSSRYLVSGGTGATDAPTEEAESGLGGTVSPCPFYPLSTPAHRFAGAPSRRGPRGQLEVIDQLGLRHEDRRRTRSVAAAAAAAAAVMRVQESVERVQVAVLPPPPPCRPAEDPPSMSRRLGFRCSRRPRRWSHAPGRRRTAV